jgi:ADP-ribose pyrophosphatase
MLKKWKLVDTKLLCSSKFLSVFDDKVILPSGKKIDFTKILLQDFVSVLAITEDDKIIMIEILRYPRNCASLEIPSGHIEKGETPKESAVRELVEETGYQAEQIKQLFSFNPLSRSTQEAYIFLSKKLKKGTQRLDDTEQINVKLVPVSEIEKMLTEGKITHAPTLLALQRYLLEKYKDSSPCDT